MSIGKKLTICEPSWRLGDDKFSNADFLDILGMRVASDGRQNLNVEERMSKARKAYYSMCSAGLPYTGLPVDIKAHLFKSVCLPTLFYGLETVYLADNMLKNIDNMQGSLIKKCLGVGKFSHHSILLRAFGLEKADSLLSRAFRDLWRRVFACDSPMRTLCSLLLARWLTGGGPDTRHTAVSRCLPRWPVSRYTCLYQTH